MLLKTGSLQKEGHVVYLGNPQLGVYYPRMYGVLIPLKPMLVSITGIPYNLLPHSIVLFSKKDVLYFDESCEESFGLILLFDKFLFDEDIQKLFQPASVFEEAKCSLDARKQLDGITDFITDLQNPIEFYEPLLKGLLNSEKAVLPNEKIVELVTYFNEHYKEPISLEKLSDASSMSKFYMCRYFTKNAGLSPHAYLNTIRVFHAEDLALESMKAQDIGPVVGFEDYTTFFRACKRALGVPPTELGGIHE